ncbi:MAG: helix-turn-helix domain-containing protein [Cyanobacteria bacterium]|nr:helix-turn-helix domain-containing protein [Cyanobacteriota bacterium]
MEDVVPLTLVGHSVVVFDIDKHKELFRLLGYDNDDGATLFLRTQLLKTLKEELEKMGCTKKKAAEKLGVKQPRISEIYALQINKFSTELLVKYLFRLGKEVNFTISDKH